MKNEIAIIVVVAFVVLLVFYFVTAKGERKKISITNSEGTAVSVDVEVADNLTTRAKGLMGRKSLGEYEGMLFVFDEPGFHSFWMVNTSIPLDAIFMDEEGTVVDVIEMEPCGLLKCPLHTPKSRAKYVLEVNQGFSKRNKIEEGSIME
jgi:uncharacterized membrane protein (UPF0127 family)